MAGSRLPAVFLVAALGVGPVIGLLGPVCSSCCPTREEGAPTISAMGCCGDGCAERLAAGEERPILTSARPSPLKAPALTVMLAVAIDHPSFFETVPSRPPWLPAFARPGTSPLRL